MIIFVQKQIWKRSELPAGRHNLIFRTSQNIKTFLNCLYSWEQKIVSYVFDCKILL